MNRVYADNGATSYPKPKEVSKAMCDFIENNGSNIGRGSYERSYAAGNIVYETRDKLCRLFNFNDPLNVVFTKNITESLNVLLKGFLRSNDHVIVSSMEHNAVMRPLNSLVAKGVEVTRIMCSREGIINPLDIEKSIKSNTKLVVMLHSSNVCGTIMPAEEVGRICKKHQVDFILDTAQTAGAVDVDFKKFNLSALAFTGHKSLLGPQGTGGFLIKDEMAKKVSPLIEGGTGSYSDMEMQPEDLPDKFEAGTLNIPGIFGLNAALSFIEKTTIDSIRQYEENLSKIFLEYVLNINGVKLSGIKTETGRTATFSLDFQNMDNSQAAFLLDRDFGIMTRVGLHCAPSAHKTMGTYPQGSVRFSFGIFNTEEEIRYIGDAINKVLKTLK